ncbi:hypothetical protein ACFLTH_16895 [Bacteroidota bacterium]
MKKSNNSGWLGKLSLTLVLFILLLVPVFAVKYDVISNTEQWFVCDATNTINDPSVFGDINPENIIPEFGTFSLRSDIINDGTASCRYEMHKIFKNDVDYPNTELGKFPTCNIPLGIDSYCCVGSLDEFDYGNFEACDCLGAGGQQITNQCDPTLNLNSNALCEPPVTNNPFQDQTEEDVAAELCKITLDCFGIDNGYEFDSSTSCEKQTNGKGITLSDGEVCSNGIVIQSTEVGRDMGPYCCFGENPEKIPFDGTKSCTAQGGNVCYDGDSCSGADWNMNGITCCFGGSCTAPSPEYNGDSTNSTFICYQEHSDSYLAECCYDGKCQNDDSRRKIIGEGNSIHQVDDFDKYINNFWKNRNKIKTGPLLESHDFIEFGGFKIEDWSDFETLEFDFAYKNLGKPSFIELVDADFNTIDVTSNISLLSTNGFGPRRWHHIIINLPSLGVSLDSKSIIAIRIGFNKPFPPVTPVYALDNIILKPVESNEAVLGNSQQKYCSGGYGVWIEDLDPGPGDLDDTSLFIPHRVACEEHMSFDWTGTKCCGDDTKLDNYGEFWEDTYNGCFNGSTVYNDWTLAESLNDYSGYNSGLLFYQEEFWVCSEDAHIHFSGVHYSDDGDETTTELIESDNNVGYMTMKGAWYCGSDGWKAIGNFSGKGNMRFIAATLKEEGETSGDYSLHCGLNKNVLNRNDSIDSVIDPDAIINIVEINSSCVLRTSDIVRIGMSVNSSDINTFLNNNLKAFHPTDSEELNCDFPLGTEFNSSNMFRACDKSGEFIEANYNPRFGILFLTMRTSNNKYSDMNFLENFLFKLINFFRGLFVANLAVPESIIPFPTYIEDEEEVYFDELYIKNVGEKQIYGLIDEGSLIVTYTGFETSVSFLKDLSQLWLGEHSSGTAYYSRDGDTQYIQITSENILEFPWNYLTSNLKFEEVPEVSESFGPQIPDI